MPHRATAQQILRSTTFNGIVQTRTSRAKSICAKVRGLRPWILRSNVRWAPAYGPVYFTGALLLCERSTRQ